MARAFFPLDEELHLLPGRLTPHLQEILVRLGSWVAFDQAAKMVTAFSGAQVSRETVRRLSEAAGTVQVAQQEAAVQAMEAGQLVKSEAVAHKLVMAVDGAMVPLLGGEWAEVRTLAVGEVTCHSNSSGKEVAGTHNLSYFSRLMSADAFGRAALAETQRRGLCWAKAVGAVCDGAEWNQGFIDYHRPDARRILDFPHAAERFTTIQQRAQAAGVLLEEGWAAKRRQQLKEEGGSAVLAELAALAEAQPQVELAEPIGYLTKREAMLAYPQFQQEGWPIGSGMVESANKLVVEARLKGAGRHWHPESVNPMLALRNIVCSERWEEAWPAMAQGLRQRHQALPTVDTTEAAPPGPNPVQVYFKEMQRLHRQWEAEQKAAEAAKTKKRWKPPADHPWRRRCLH